MNESFEQELAILLAKHPDDDLGLMIRSAQEEGVPSKEILKAVLMLEDFEQKKDLLPDINNQNYQKKSERIASLIELNESIDGHSNSWEVWMDIKLALLLNRITNFIEFITPKFSSKSHLMASNVLNASLVLATVLLVTLYLLKDPVTTPSTRTTELIPNIEPPDIKIQRGLIYSDGILKTEANATGFFDVEGKLKGSVAQGSSFQFDEPNRMRLVSGGVWLDVEKNSKGFIVETPTGNVEVHGTRFGVFISEGQTKVSVSEGLVAVKYGEAEQFIDAGQEIVSIPGVGLGNPAERFAAMMDPTWAVATEWDRENSIGLSPVFTDCTVLRNKIGYEMVSPGNGLVLRRLESPVKKQASFEFYMQSSHPRASEKRKQNVIPQDYRLNGFFVFGQEADREKLILCGANLVSKLYGIYQGENMQSGRMTKRKKAQIVGDELLHVIVSIDIEKRIIKMNISGTELIAPLPESIHEINYIGTSTQKSQTAFSEIMQVK